MAVFRYAADRPYVAGFLAMSALDLTVYFTVSHPLWLMLYFVATIFARAPICAFNHHHQHLSTFKVEWLNRLLEIPYALQTGISSHAWVLHHSVGHHLNYLDQTKDESRWAREDGSKMGELEYSLLTTVTAYPRAWAVSASYPRFRRVFVTMGLLTLSIVAAAVAHRPVPGLIIYVLAPAVSLFGTAWATYDHHAGLETSSHFVASFNILQPFYNWLTGNLGYHTAHHYKPGVHWSKLPELHAEIAPKLQADAYRIPGWPWSLMEPKERPEQRPVEDSDAEPVMMVTATAAEEA